MTREALIPHIHHFCAAHGNFIIVFGVNHTLYCQLSQRFAPIVACVIPRPEVIAKSGSKWEPGGIVDVRGHRPLHSLRRTPCDQA